MTVGKTRTQKMFEGYSELKERGWDDTTAMYATANAYNPSRMAKTRLVQRAIGAINKLVPRRKRRSDVVMREAVKEEFNIQHSTESNASIAILDEQHMDKAIEEKSKWANLIENLKNGPPAAKLLAVFLLAPKGLFLFSPILIKKYMAPMPGWINLSMTARVVVGVGAWVTYRRCIQKSLPFNRHSMTTQRFCIDAIRTLGEFGTIYGAIFASTFMWDRYFSFGSRQILTGIESIALEIQPHIISNNLSQYLYASFGSVFLGAGLS